MALVLLGAKTEMPPLPTVSEFTPPPSISTESVLLERNVSERMEKFWPSVVLTNPPGVTRELKKTSSVLVGRTSGSRLDANCWDQLVPNRPALMFQLEPLSPVQ